MEFVSSSIRGPRAGRVPAEAPVLLPARATRPSRSARPISAMGPQANSAACSTLGDLLADLLPAAALQAARRLVAVESDLRSADLARPLPDAVALRPRLLRVLANAVEHNLVGGLVWLGLADGGGGPALVIADTGFGMSDEQAARLQAALGPGVTVQSVLGAGTRVRIALDGGAAAAGSRAAMRHDGGLPAEEPQGTVLCVEDHEVDYCLIEEALARWPKVRVLRTASVRGALEAMAMLRPCVTLLDMRLADGSGMDVLPPIRSNPATAGLRVFMLSAEVMPQQMRAAFDAGADGYWTKPLAMDQFLEKMHELLLRDRGSMLQP